jgi:APA family basic amino acid/polyamine antiporter
MLIVIALYVAVNLAYLHALTMDEIATANSTRFPTAPSVASRAAISSLGPHAGLALPILFMISAIGTLHCNLLAVPRIFFSMARDGLLPSGFARVSTTTRTPIVAITTLAVVGAALAVLGSYDRLTNMAAFGNVLFYALNAFGLLWWRRRESERRSQRIGSRAWIPAVFCAGMVALVIALVVRGNVEIIAAIALLIIGLPVYALMRGRRKANFVT